MDTALSQEQLEKMLDQAVQDVTEKAVGVRLHPDTQPPGGKLCTAHITFKKGFQSCLTLCADTSMLTRMARSVVRKDRVSEEDLEDFIKEYLNLLCGRIATLLYQATRVPVRFSVPAFHNGRFEPEGHWKQFTLNYANDHQEGAQLTHHVPCDDFDETR